VAVISVLGCLAVLSSGLPAPNSLVLSALALVFGAIVATRRFRPGIVGLRVQGSIVLVTRASVAELPGRLVGLPFVSPVYVGFRWRPEGARLPRAVGVFRHQMKAADFRRLCAELRQGSEA
jgi:hypothetical protein